MTRSVLVRPRRAAPVFVCRKCLKRNGDPKAIKKAIKRAVKTGPIAPAEGAGEKPGRIIMTSCFGLCPKRAVVVTGGAGAARGEYVLLSSADDAATAVRRLRSDQNRSPSESSPSSRR